MTTRYTLFESDGANTPYAQEILAWGGVQDSLLMKHRELETSAHKERSPVYGLDGFVR